MPSSLSLKNRLIIFFLMLVSTILVGSLGYVIIKMYVEHTAVSITDAIFFSVATISTLGHYPRGIELTSDVGKWFTILYLIFGMGTIFGGIQALVSPWIEMRIRNAVKEKRIPVPADAHVVLCGWNDVAQLIQEHLEMMDIPYVIVSPSPPPGVPAVKGSAEDSNALKKANIERAIAMVCVMSDRSNMVSILTARKLNREIRIIALSKSSELRDLILKSGADVVISKEDVLSSMLQHWISGDFKHIFRSEILEGMKVSELVVDEDMAGKTLSAMRFRERMGTVIGIYRDGRLVVDPDAEEQLQKGDVVIFMEVEKNAGSGVQ